MLLDEIATFLWTALSLTVYKGSMPDTPDEALTVYEYGGFAPVHAMGGADHLMRRPRIQIACRGPIGDYATPRTTADLAYSAMHMSSATLSGTAYFRVEAVDEPFPLERDSNDRWIICCNYEIWKA